VLDVLKKIGEQISCQTKNVKGDLFKKNRLDLVMRVFTLFLTDIFGENKFYLSRYIGF